MSETRLTGMSMSRARRLRLTPSGCMNSSSRISPGGIGVSFFAIAVSLLVVVDNFNLPGIPVDPAEADPPLVIDTDAVLPAPIALKCFERIARRRAKLFERLDGV